MAPGMVVVRFVMVFQCSLMYSVYENHWLRGKGVLVDSGVGVGTFLGGIGMVHLFLV